MNPTTQPLCEIHTQETTERVIVRVKHQGRWVRLGPAATQAIRQLQRGAVATAPAAQCVPDVLQSLQLQVEALHRIERRLTDLAAVSRRAK